MSYGLWKNRFGSDAELIGKKLILNDVSRTVVGIMPADFDFTGEIFTLEYCFDYAKILPGDLSMVVLCAQGRTSAPNQDLTRNPYLKVVSNNTPVLKISYHSGHAVGAFATSGFKDAAILVVDGVGSPAEDMSDDERAAVVKEVEDGWETISLYAASGTSIKAVEKHLVERCRWTIPNRGGMYGFQSLGGMFSAVSKQIFGDLNEAGKVMGLAPSGSPEIPTDQFLEIVNGQIIFSDKVPARFGHNDRWPSHETDYKNLACRSSCREIKSPNFWMNW